MDITTVPSEYLEAELVAHAAWEATGMARMLDVLGEFDRRRVWEQWGCASPQQWLGWKCALGYVAASERLRVARVLGSLPAIRDGLSRGDDVVVVLPAGVTRFPAGVAPCSRSGNTVDRSIEFAPFVAPAPADQNLITGTWTGERLHLDWLHLTVNSPVRVG